VLELHDQGALLFHKHQKLVEDGLILLEAAKHSHHDAAPRFAPDLLADTAETLSFPGSSEPRDGVERRGR
jgi:hypothetical protein